MFANAEKTLLNDMPFAPLFYTDVSRFQHNYVDGVIYPLFRTDYKLKEACMISRE